MSGVTRDEFAQPRRIYLIESTTDDVGQRTGQDEAGRIGEVAVQAGSSVAACGRGHCCCQLRVGAPLCQQCQSALSACDGETSSGLPSSRLCAVFRRGQPVAERKEKRLRAVVTLPHGEGLRTDR